MNKYQEYLLKYNLDEKFVFNYCCPMAKEFEVNKTQYGKFDKKTDTFTITQDADINIVDYVLLIEKDDKISEILNKVYIQVKDKWKEVSLVASEKNQNAVYKISVSFNNRTEKIKLSFKNNLADDYILNIKYVEADKDAYYSKQEQKKKDNLLNTANIKHSTGNDLVNIYFLPCCEEYERTEIILFKDNQMLAKYKVDDGVFFKSIGGLAYGTYEYIVKQFGKDDKLLLETDKIKFSISAPYYGGRRNIVIG